MSIPSWIVLGLIVGVLASRLMGAGDYSLVGDIVVGILGAIAGGWLGSNLLGIGVTGLNFTSTVLAVVGAVAVLALFRAFVLGGRRRRNLFR